MSGRTASQQSLRLWCVSGALALVALVGGTVAIASTGASVEQPEPIVDLTVGPARPGPATANPSPRDVSVQGSLSR